MMFDSVVTIFNALVFSVVINYVGNIIDNINARKAELTNRLKLFETFFNMK